MSDTINNGGPAFPAVKIKPGDNYNPITKVYYDGMTMRDYFAAKAMVGMMSNFQLMNAVLEASSKMNESREKMIAATSYHIADEMIKTRSAK